MKDYIFWSEIGSGFGEPGGTPPPRIFRSTPPPPGVPVLERSPSYRKSNKGSKQRKGPTLGVRFIGVLKRESIVTVITF